MTVDPAQAFQRVFDALRMHGLLLVSDKTFPSVSGLIVGEQLKGSWWSHPLAHTIFGVNEILEDHKDVLITKLVDRKVTFVHRNIWKHVYAIATDEAPWQVKDLSAEEKALLKRIQNEERLDTTKLRPGAGVKVGDVVRVLEERLLIHSEQVHTESGAHAKIIETWDNWANQSGLKERRIAPAVGKQFLETRVKELNTQFGARSKLPWQ